VLIVERYLFKINQEVVNTLSHSIDKKEETKSVKLPIVSENKNESFEIDMECLLCIKSAGNYVDVYYLENDKTISKLIRTSLTKLDEYYIEFKNIQRCHRTHIVNLDNISEVTGNARNYNFHIDYLDFIIPVSRSFSKEIISELKND
jgi:DNA-binding LytR/AlgR family response regulator